MTNEQTYLLLKQIYARLGAAIEEAEERMPEGVERETVRQHVDDTCPGMCCMNSKHFKDFPGPNSLALSPLRHLLDELSEDAEKLAPPSIPA